MVQASILVADRNIFIKPQQLEGNMKLDPQGKPLSVERSSNTTKMLLYSH